MNLDITRPVRAALWAPVAFGAGALVYFSLPQEPAPILSWLCFLLGCGLSAIALLWLRPRPVLWSVLVLIAFVALGFARGQHHTVSQSPVFVDGTERARDLTGWLERVESRNGRERLIVRVANLEGFDSPPQRVRFYGQRGTLRPGDGVTARVVLTPPRRPAVARGYDPQFAAWFSGLGGTGFAIAPLSAAEIDGDGLIRALAGFRWQLAERIRSRAHPETAGIAAALLTGDRSGIPADHAEALRAAGLGHILAISGLHMSLFAGGLFFAVRAAGAAIPAFSRKHDPRIPAAIAALCGAVLYLILSGAAIATQRAFVMVAVILIGVLLKRRAFSMQSIALAAGIILLLQPQSLLSPGFQMSFAAAAALVAAFDFWRTRPVSTRSYGVVQKLAGFWSSLSLSSLVAGFATGAFAAFHFNRIAVYGFLANLAAMPVFSLIVMPAGAVALVLAPFGLDGPALSVMSWGLIWVVRIAEWVSNWPGSLAPMVSAPGSVLALYAAGFTLVVAARELWRWLGVALMLLAYSFWLTSPQPDVFVSEDAVVLARFGDELEWTSSDRRRARFAASVFLEQSGQRGERPGREGLLCDPRGCAGTAQGLGITIAYDAETLQEDCNRSDLVVLRAYASPVQRADCSAHLIDLGDLVQTGARSLLIERGQIVQVRTVEDQRGRRVWTQSGR